MIKTLIRRLFLSEKKRNEIIKDQERNPNVRTGKEAQNHEIDSDKISGSKLEKGKIQSVFTPDVGNQKGLTLTKWYFKPGDIVKYGDIICDIENENISIEFETAFSGKLLSTCKLNEKLTRGTEIFKIEGI